MDLKNIKILVVDDSQDILDLFMDLLGDHHTVLTAPNGKEALAIKLKDESIKVILSDINMPIMGGFDLCKEIRKVDNLAIVIGFTEHFDSSTALEARKVGFDDIYEKPLHPDVMLELVERSLTKIERWTNFI